jgi:hypothetical protein
MVLMCVHINHIKQHVITTHVKHILQCRLAMSQTAMIPKIGDICGIGPQTVFGF